MYSIKYCGEYAVRLKRLSKSHRREVEAVHSNLVRYLKALNLGTPPKQIQGGWIHSEPMDVVALDERGGGKKEGGRNKGKGLVPIRLYIFPFVALHELHVITLGQKDTQSDDVRFAKHYVAELLKSHASGPPATGDRPTDERC
jgi:hypothetical protein